jgi:hypothetical protein
MTDKRTLITLIGALRAAAAHAADDIITRDSGRGFLESVLRDALAVRLPNARTEQPLNLDPAVWPGRLGGVDVLYGDDGARIGVETKVWDVADSLYDLLKLAAGTQRGTIVAGCCVVAGRTRDWRSPSAIRDLSVAPLGKATDRDVATLLRDDRHGWAHIWSRTAIRPAAVPARIRTIAVEPIPMLRAPDHEIRIIGVQAISHDQLRLDPAGNPT